MNSHLSYLIPFLEKEPDDSNDNVNLFKSYFSDSNCNSTPAHNTKTVLFRTTNCRAIRPHKRLGQL